MSETTRSGPTPLRVERLSQRFGERKVLNDVSLVVEEGRVVSVLGPSGSGKSTLLRCVAGFARPDAGRITIAGTVVWEDRREAVPAERRNVGMVFQDYALFPHMTVEQNIRFGIERDPKREERVRRLIGLVGLDGLEQRRPEQLSGGQQQRVALARALAPRPALLLLDEPFANLDASRRGELFGEVRRVLREERASALLVTHDRTEALGMSDEVAVLGYREEGAALLQTGTPREVYERPIGRQVARITGVAQFIDGDGSGDHAQTPLGKVPLLAPAQGPVEVLIRPEALDWDPDPAGENHVESVQYLGRGYRIWCLTPTGRLCVDRDGRRAPQVGERGTLRLVGACWAVAK